MLGKGQAIRIAGNKRALQDGGWKAQKEDAIQIH